MSVALLLVTHKSIGRDMLKIVGSIMGVELHNTACVEAPMDADVDTIKAEISAALEELATGEGALILTDSYGSTPCNIASEFLGDSNRLLVSGLNLPMLIRIMNYRSLPLSDLKDVAIQGGRKGIISRTD